MKVASLLWLLGYELRLWWREVRSKPGMMAWSIGLGVLFAGAFLLLWLALASVREVMSPARWQDPEVQSYLAAQGLPELAFWTAVIGWLVGLFYAFIQAMQQSAYALFDRGDLDLLVSSPISSKVIFASRLLSVALRIFLNYCPIVVPMSLFAVAIGFPQLLGLYPALIGLSLSTASLAMLLTLWLVRWLGARRARTFAQVLTALLSALLFLSTQLPNLLRGVNVDRGGLAALRSGFEAGGILAAESQLWFPVRAIFLDLPSVLLTLLTSGILMWIAVETLHRSFVGGTQQSVTTVKRSVRLPSKIRFSGGFNRVMLLKEWRIIWRNPYLMSATFLQVLFLIPALVIVLRGEGGNAIASFSTFITVTSVVVGESLTQTLTRLCVSGEEAPDLLKSSPVQGQVLRRFKLLAALIPVWLLMLPLFVILMIQGERWFMPLLLFLSATTCAAMLRLWNSQPIRLADIGKRQQNAQGDLPLGILETLSLFAWAWLGLMIYQGEVWMITLPIAVIVIVVAIAYWRSQQLGSSLGF